MGLRPAQDGWGGGGCRLKWRSVAEHPAGLIWTDVDDKL